MKIILLHKDYLPISVALGPKLRSVENFKRGSSYLGHKWFVQLHIVCNKSPTNLVVKIFFYYSHKSAVWALSTQQTGLNQSQSPTPFVSLFTHV